MRSRWLFAAVAAVVLCGVVWSMVRVRPALLGSETIYFVYSGIRSHDSLLKRFPQDGHKKAGGTSWRFQVRRFIEDIKFQPYDLDEDWNAGPNAEMAAQVPGHPFFCFRRSNLCTVFAIEGHDSCWDPGFSAQLSDLPTNYVLFVVGVTSKHHWMQPGDLSNSDFLKMAAGGSSPEGFGLRASVWLCFADGTGAELRLPVSESLLAPFLSLTTAGDADRSRLSEHVMNRSESRWK